MFQLISNLARLAADRSGVTALEYGLIASVIVVAVTLVGTNLTAGLTAIAASV